MTLPVGTISMSQVNTELGLPSTTNISLNQANVRALAGVPSGTISMSNLQGKSNFTLGFNSAAEWNLQSLRYDGPTSAFLTFPWETPPEPPGPGVANRGDIYITANQIQSGPTAWGSPLTPGIGGQYQVRVVIYYVNSTGGSNLFYALYGYFYGADTTLWQTITGELVVQASSFPTSGTGWVESAGEIQIRNSSTGATISRPYYMRAEGAEP